MDRLTPQHRSENMRRIRSKDSVAELLVRRMVYSLGYRYRLNVKTLPGKPDLVFRRLNKIIFVHGCFWHSHPGCIDSHIPKTRTCYWAPKLARNVERDKRCTRELRQAGWRVLVVWECGTGNSVKLSRRLERFLIN